MIINLRSALYFLLFCSVLFVDQITKLIAINFFEDQYVINPFLFFELT